MTMHAILDLKRLISGGRCLCSLPLSGTGNEMLAAQMELVLGMLEGLRA